MQDNTEKKERVIVYIDGFNLYFGLRNAGYSKCKWLNLYAFSKSLLKENQELISVKYFTSRITKDPERQKRQNTYLEALEAAGVKILYGKFQADKVECLRCGRIWINYNEKLTDVNLATHMLVDAYKDQYDTAVLVSGDSDLVPPVRSVHENFSNKRVFIVFPPRRHNVSMSAVARGTMIIGRKKLNDHQFPEYVTNNAGYTLKKPENW